MLKTNTSKFNELPDDTFTYLTKTYLSSSDAYFFAKTSTHYRQQWLNEHKDKGKKLKDLFEAIIDDHQESVKTILDKDPWLLLETREKIKG